MSDLPIPPTDNLYKFVSLTGAGLLLISLVGPFRLQQESRLRQFELQADVDRVGAEETTLSERVARDGAKTGEIRTRVTALEKETAELTNGPLRGDETKSDVLRRLDAVNQEVAGLEQRLGGYYSAVDTLFQKKVEHRARARTVEYLGSRVVFLSRLAIVGVMAGVGLMVLGLALWYRKVQVLQDQLLSLEVQGKRHTDHETSV